MQSQARKRVRRFQAVSHALAGLNLAYLALSGGQGGSALPWVAGIAAVLLLGLVGWEQAQPGAQPPMVEIAAEILGMVVLVTEGLEKLHLGKRYLPFAYFFSAAVLGAALLLHRRWHRAQHAAEKGVAG
ncbi:MAG TPA: hypothetical protein VFN45_15640 [Myxococcaceae bacterium]|nr:hypothetical protein [Myxococcaceae bacterium]